MAKIKKKLKKPGNVVQVFWEHRTCIYNNTNLYSLNIRISKYENIRRVIQGLPN